jgi:hypothetical protein
MGDTKQNTVGRYAMIVIPTARGLPIFADDEDEDLLARYSWYAVKNSHGDRHYAHARTPGAGAGALRVIMHRLIMDPPSKLVVHHRNNNGLDNRRENLVVVTQGRNMAESFTARGGGVHFYKSTGKWRGQIRQGSKRISIGMYLTKEEAIAAVNSARVKYGIYPPLT